MGFGKLFEIIETNLGRLKTIGVMVLIVLFSISALKNGCDRKDAENMVEKLTGLNIQNDILRSGIMGRDSLIEVGNKRISRLNDSLVLSQKIYKQLEIKYGRLERKYEQISDSLLKIPADSSYSFLSNVAYPFDGEKKYPFNEPQVRGIHTTYLQKENLLAMNYNLKDQITQLGKQNLIKNTTGGLMKDNMVMMSSNRNDLEKIITNKDEEIATKDKQLKKERRKRIFQVTGTAIVGGTLLIISLFGGG